MSAADSGPLAAPSFLCSPAHRVGGSQELLLCVPPAAQPKRGSPPEARCLLQTTGALGRAQGGARSPGILLGASATPRRGTALSCVSSDAGTVLTSPLASPRTPHRGVQPSTQYLMNPCSPQAQRLSARRPSRGYDHLRVGVASPKVGACRNPPAVYPQQQQQQQHRASLGDEEAGFLCSPLRGALCERERDGESASTPRLLGALSPSTPAALRGGGGCAAAERRASDDHPALGVMSSPWSFGTFDTATAASTASADHECASAVSKFHSFREPPLALHLGAGGGAVQTSWNPFVDAHNNSFRGDTPARKQLGALSFQVPRVGMMNVHCIDGVEYLLMRATPTSLAAVDACTSANAPFVASQLNVWREDDTAVAGGELAGADDLLMQMDLTSADGALLPHHAADGLCAADKDVLRVQLQHAVRAVHDAGYTLQGTLSEDGVWASTARESYLLCDLYHARELAGDDAGKAADLAAVDRLVDAIPTLPDGGAACRTPMSSTAPSSLYTLRRSSDDVLCPYAEALRMEIAALEMEAIAGTPTAGGVGRRLVMSP